MIAKQIIVMRTDLNMRKGKMVAQGAHASLGVVWLFSTHTYSLRVHDAYNAWREGAFTKVCVGVDSEQALIEIAEMAYGVGLPVKLITDAGKTEFNGVPTRTCAAIGPAWNEDIDPITGGLRLL